MNTAKHFNRRSFLCEVAEIQAGYPSRGRIDASLDGPYRLLQARDVSSNFGVRWQTAIRFDPDRKPDPYVISKDDVLLVARGQVHDAYLISKEPPHIVASSVFYVVRPRKDLVVPAYLAWVLNQPFTQAQINTAASGTGISYLSRTAVERLAVVVPPLATQCRIVETLGLWRRRKALQDRIAALRELIVQTACRRTLTSMTQ